MPPSLTQSDGRGEEIAGEYDRGPSTRMRTSLCGVDEANPGEMSLRPEKKGVSEEWLASGKAGELAEIMEEMATAHRFEVLAMNVGEYVLIRERDELGQEGDILSDMIWRAQELERMSLADFEFDDGLTVYIPERLESKLHGVYVEGDNVDRARLDLCHSRQKVVDRWNAFKTLGQVMAGVGAHR